MPASIPSNPGPGGAVTAVRGSRPRPDRGPSRRTRRLTLTAGMAFDSPRMTEPRAGPDPFRLSGTTLDGRFHVAREIAEGGFGVVYYAIQIALDRPVALKVLKSLTGMNDTARDHFHEKFAAEARTIARIRHPNIVDVYDFGISRMPSGELAPWMALEWIKRPYPGRLSGCSTGAGRPTTV